MSLLSEHFSDSLAQPLLRNGDIEIAKNKELPNNTSSDEFFYQDDHTIQHQLCHNDNKDNNANFDEHPSMESYRNLHESESRLNPRGGFGGLQSFFYMIIFVAAVMSELGIIYDDYKQHHEKHVVPKSHRQPQPENLPPFISRIDEIYECAAKLSGSDSITSIKDGPQWHALQWFIDGAGRLIPAPKSSQCSYDSSHEFVQMYGLLVVRESLQLDESTWGYDEKDPVRSLKDVCQKWHRLTCNDHNTVITKLHLADMDATTLSGFIPKEIAALASLERIELYSNDGLVGTIPQEISQLKSLEYLYLQHTLVDGKIPSSFGSLKNLKELFLDDTNLMGSVPLSLCSLRINQENVIFSNVLETDGSLELLHADCAGDHPRVQCEEPKCCTDCYSHE